MDATLLTDRQEVEDLEEEIVEDVEEEDDVSEDGTTEVPLRRKKSKWKESDWISPDLVDDQSFWSIRDHIRERVQRLMEQVDLV